MRIYTLLTFFLFFSIGSIFPLLPKYLVSNGFTGSKIGLIFSMGTFIAIIFQPFWGIIADRTNKTKKIMISLMLVSSCLLLFFPFIKIHLYIVVLYLIMNMFLCGLAPLNDAIIARSSFQYGKIRQWGAIGFAIAVQVVAISFDYLSKYSIFIIAATSLLISIYFLKKLEIKTNKSEKIDYHLVKNLLKNKDYLFFILVAFFIGGTINGNNTFFGLLYVELGGQVSGVGFAFLLFALSEAPFLASSNSIIKKIGVNNLLIISSITFCLRWFFYSTQPSTTIILLTFAIQGLSIGTFLAAAIEYIKIHTKSSQTSTAIAVYSSVSLGMGSMICIYIAGKIMDTFNVAAVYKFYFLWSSFGFLLLTAMLIREKIKRKKNEPFKISEKIYQK